VRSDGCLSQVLEYDHFISSFSFYFSMLGDDEEKCSGEVRSPVIMERKGQNFRLEPKFEERSQKLSANI
jgi:hypothetical protein